MKDMLEPASSTRMHDSATVVAHALMYRRHIAHNFARLHSKHINSERFDDGRFTVLHKLGWGGYGTTWLALDRSLSRNVALKLSAAEISPDSSEIQVHHLLSSGSDRYGGKPHIAELLHSFTLEGPNGKHDCIVTELLGPSADAAAQRYGRRRLPGRLAWQAVRQVTKALAYMHEEGVVHGDLHPGNILLPCDDRFKHPDSEAVRALGLPTKGDVHATSYTSSLPRYMVRPISLPLAIGSSNSCTFKVIDFGSSFRSGLNPSPRMRCPLPFRAPEAVLTRQWDKPADIWSLGCTIFSLIVGQPPFDSIFSDERSLTADWIATFGPLPQEWDNVVVSFKDIELAELDCPDLVEWLRELYFDEDRKPFFVEEDIEKIGDLILSLLKYRPEERPTARELLDHPLIRKDPFSSR
ncbi:protein kinase [Zymoseptoria brevis]|uniref:Protein kinase n=1 Tax=Zymoseptoria brevis TaxID=1047168 RepID=A0A0F4GUI7_9PEZI|nr:protein kinase [Zymoseptoria brevis]